ncbi:MAG: OmpA family protein [Myxococcales bacterium]|nr:OmpA family protein [Myxococcales bacterium]
MRRKHFGRTALAVATLLGALGAGREASAQTAGWALNRFEPAPVGDVFFFTDHPWYTETRRFSVGLFGDYARNPLVLRQDTDTGPRTVSVVSDMLTAHLAAAFALHNRVAITANLPLSVYQDGDTPPSGTTGLRAASGAAVGDLRLGARVRLLGHADRDAFSLHIGVNFWAPLGSQSSFTGDENIRVEPRLLLAGRATRVRWSASAGFTVRSDLNATNLAIGNEVRLGGALGIVLADERLTIGPEAYVVSSVRDLPQGGGSAFFASQQWGGEALLSAHYNIADTVLVGAGAGMGLEQGFGIPAARGILSVAYAPVNRPAPAGPVDTDGDGIFDPDDLCPTVHMGPHPDPNRRGCPAQDSDSDGVYDFEDQCVMVPQGEHPDPERRGCPLADRDQDGVFDPDDVCVDVPQGPHPDPERRGCPDGDRDHDTVLDHADQCPDVPQGIQPDPNRPGCPLPDRDHDLVPDPTDHCPDQPGAPSSDPNQNGCPTLVRIEQGHISILTPVFFDTDRDTIKPQSFRVLERVADVLRSLPQIRRVGIEGHTDNRATHEHNMDLSQRRAVAVMRFLTQHGVEETRLEAHGYGPDRPIATNNTVLGRARNRRVEFLILDPPQDAGVQSQSAANADPGAPVDRR